MTKPQPNQRIVHDRMGYKRYLDACGIEFDPELDTADLWKLAHLGAVLENPWPAATVSREFGLNLWTETTEATYYEYLGDQPTIAEGPFWFQTSEPSSHTAQNVPIYGGIAMVKDRGITHYFAKEATIAQFKLQALMLANLYRVQPDTK